MGFTMCNSEISRTFKFLNARANGLVLLEEINFDVVKPGHLSIVGLKDGKLVVLNLWGNHKDSQYLKFQKPSSNSENNESQIFSHLRYSIIDLSELNKLKFKVTLDDEILVYGPFGLMIVIQDFNDGSLRLEKVCDCFVNDACTFKKGYYIINQNGVLCEVVDPRNVENICCDGDVIEDCVQIEASYEHLAVLTNTGKVYCLGNGTRGQLGCGYAEIETQNTFFVKTLSSLNIVEIFCGGWHTLARTDLGHVYGWGWNESFQINNTNMPIIHTPTRINFTEENQEVTIKCINAGSQHSVALDANNHIWAWGSNYFSQSNTEKEKIIDSPKKIIIDGKYLKASLIHCGRWTTFIRHVNSST